MSIFAALETVSFRSAHILVWQLQLCPVASHVISQEVLIYWYVNCNSVLLPHSSFASRPLSSGGPKSDTTNIHKTALTRKKLVNNTKKIYRQQDSNRLQIMEALSIQQQRPSINNQVTGSHLTFQLYWNNIHTLKYSPAWLRIFHLTVTTPSRNMHTPTVPR